MDLLNVPFETGIPVDIDGRKFLLYQGELLPAVYGGAEAQDPESEEPPAPPDLQTILASVSKEVGKIVRTSLKPVQEKLTALDAWRQEVDSRFKPADPEMEDEDPPVDPGETEGKKKAPGDGALKKQLRELNEQVTSLKAQNLEAQKRTEEVTMKERLNNRDRLLTDSLSDVGVVSVAGGLKFFRDDLQFDDESEEWFHTTKDGARYTVPEMVQKFTPDWLKKPANPAGGSGGGKPQGVAAHKAEVQKVKKLAENAKNSGSQPAAMAYWRARRDAIAAGVSPEELDAAVS